MAITTRFAPSPTGALHIGGVRTALFCWLYSRQNNGRFILRIEDTDNQRSTKASTEQIVQTIKWLGLNYDELYYQSERSEIYQRTVQQLLENNQAYYCHCSEQRLETLRSQQIANQQKPKYDGRCRNLGLAYAPGAVIRFRNPEQGLVEFIDQVRGNIAIDNEELDDLIIVRSDGTPTYNLCCVIDDVDMDVTLVMRGDDHINNTPRQINIYQALGGKVPDFAHIPMILGQDGKRLSKRHGASSLLEYRDQGYLPEAVLNYLARLGWSHGDQEIFSLAELIEVFDLVHINHAPASYSEDKFVWINKQHLKNTPNKKIANLLIESFGIKSISAQLNSLLPLYIERSQTLVQLAEALAPYGETLPEYDPKAAKKHLTSKAIEALRSSKDAFEQIDNWRADKLHSAIHNIAENLAVSIGKVGMPLRVAVTATSFSPPIDQVLECIGKQRVINRIEQAILFIVKKDLNSVVE